MSPQLLLGCVLSFDPIPINKLHAHIQIYCYFTFNIIKYYKHNKLNIMTIEKHIKTKAFLKGFKNFSLHKIC